MKTTFNFPCDIAQEVQEQSNSNKFVIKATQKAFINALNNLGGKKKIT